VLRWPPALGGEGEREANFNLHESLHSNAGDDVNIRKTALSRSPETALQADQSIACVTAGGTAPLFFFVEKFPENFDRKSHDFLLIFRLQSLTLEQWAPP
jgi:hypothetical protein